MKTGRVIGERKIQEIARDIVNDGSSDYIIVTRKGQKISLQEIFVRSKANIKSHGKSIACHSAWDGLRKFYADLETAGVLD